MVQSSQNTEEKEYGRKQPKTASDIENMVVTPNKPVAPYKQCFGVGEPKLKILKTFGEMAVVENHDR
jgi:hypothetical protein